MELGKLVSVISAIGFGIQQFLQVIADPIISVLIGMLKSLVGKQQADGSKVLPYGVSDTDAKKSLLGLLSLGIGLLIVCSADDIRLLNAIGFATLPRWDLFITALTISAGTEGANSVLKLAQYVKDAVRAHTVAPLDGNPPGPPPPPPNINPSADSLDFAATPNSGDDVAASETGEDAIPLVPEPVAAFSLTATASPWRVARSLLVLRDQINSRAPHRNRASDGFIGDAVHATRQSDHNPWIKDGNMGVVTAFDITHDAGHGCDGNAVSEALWNGKDPRIKYIIWNRRIANSSAIGGEPAWKWRPYGGSDPHTNHVHLSVRSDKAHYDSTTPWTI